MFFDANPEEVPLRRNHIVTPAHANDLEEPLSPKEPEQATVTPRKANY